MQTSTANKPNILWIMDDQHKYNLLSCCGGPKGITPNLDMLAHHGTTFINAYTPSPVCGPARACLKTGKFPSYHGETNNWVNLNSNNLFLPQLLKNNGYSTGMAGKLHLCPQQADYGFQKAWISDAPYSVYAHEDKNSDYIAWLQANYFNKKNIDAVPLFDADELCYENNLKRFISGTSFRNENEHDTNWVTQRTLQFLESANEQSPFFFFASYFGPHQPYTPPAPYCNYYKPEDVTLPQSYYSSKNRNSPVFTQNAGSTWQHISKNLSEEDVKTLVAQNWNHVRMIDHYIGKIVDYLKQKNMYDNTCIIFTSDHGDHLGEHGLFFKGQMYDSCAKVPLIIKPVNSHSPSVCSNVVNTIDIYETLLDFSNTHVAQKTQSRTLVPLINGENSNWPNTAYSVIGSNRNNLLCMLRKNNWKLIRLATGNSTDAVYEMYNLEQDLSETNNLYNDNNHSKKREELKQMLDKWFVCQYNNFNNSHNI